MQLSANSAALQSPRQWYAQALKQGFSPDTAQRKAVTALEGSYQLLRQGQVQGASLYLWGPPGRGKTWMMDRFFANLPCAGRRQHFHHFMRDLHRALYQLSGSANPLQQLARRWAAEIRVLCFDELFVSDIADAMLLGPLFEQLFIEGVAVVATSNQQPQQLYADGFNRQRFMPAIAAIERWMQVVSVDGHKDHRLQHSAEEDLPGLILRDAQSETQMAQLFSQACGQTAQAGQIELGGRILQVHGCADAVLWCDYAELCEQPRAAGDYIELAQRFDQLLLSGVPRLGGQTQPVRIARGTEDGVLQVVAGDRVLPALAVGDDAARRFIALIDELYEGKVRLRMESAVRLDELYNAGHLLFPFHRILSRLHAMLGSQ